MLMMIAMATAVSAAGFPRRRKHCPVRKPGFRMRVPARAMPCLTRPKLRKCPKCLERTHPRLPLHATPPTRYVCSFRSLLMVVSGDKNTLFFDTNPPLRHISGVVSLHASPPARTSLFSRRCPFLFRVRRRSFTLISCPFLPVFPIC